MSKEFYLTNKSSSTSYFDRFYNFGIFAKVFHTLIYCLNKELKDCDSVLDLGCGSDSPIKHCNIKYSVGVDAHLASLKISEKKNIHSEYIHSELSTLKLNKRFDAVVMIDVIEHLNKDEGIKVLKLIEKWSKKKIIITTPNGFVFQETVEKNPLQKHISGWSEVEMRKEGYQVRGLAGLKLFRNVNYSEKNINNRKMYSSIKFKPKKLWFIIAGFSQLFTYYNPRYAFELFCVKNINK